MHSCLKWSSTVPSRTWGWSPRPTMRWSPMICSTITTESSWGKVKDAALALCHFRVRQLNSQPQFVENNIKQKKGIILATEIWACPPSDAKCSKIFLSQFHLRCICESSAFLLLPNSFLLATKVSQATYYTHCAGDFVCWWCMPRSYVIILCLVYMPHTYILPWKKNQTEGLGPVLLSHSCVSKCHVCVYTRVGSVNHAYP